MPQEIIFYKSLNPLGHSENANLISSRTTISGCRNVLIRLAPSNASNYNFVFCIGIWRCIIVNANIGLIGVL